MNIMFLFMLLDQRASRAGVVKRALYEFFKKEGIIGETIRPVKTQGETPKLDDFSVTIKETFLAHTIIEMAKETTLPPDHLDLKKLEQNIRQFITKRAEERGETITKEHLDKLTKETLEYHKEMLKGLALITSH